MGHCATGSDFANVSGAIKSEAAMDEDEMGELEFEFDEACGGLQSVDDLEVAKLAAEADLARLALLQQSACTQTGAEPAAEQGACSDEDDDSALDVLDGSKQDAWRHGAADASVHVKLLVVDGQVSVRIDPMPQGAGQQDVNMEDEDEESDSDTDEDLESVHELGDIMDMVEAAGAAAADDSAAATLTGPRHGVEGLEAVALLEVEVAESDDIRLAGRVQSIVDGLVVVAGLENSPALDGGTLICMEDRTVIGLIEDVFGPVMAPLYTLRYQGKGELPAQVAPGARVYSVAKMTMHVDRDALAQAPCAVARDADDDSDLDAESHDGECGDAEKREGASEARVGPAASARGPAGRGRGSGRGQEARGQGGRGGRGAGRSATRAGGRGREGLGRGDAFGRGQGRSFGARGGQSPLHIPMWQPDGMQLSPSSGRGLPYGPPAGAPPPHGGRGAPPRGPWPNQPPGRLSPAAMSNGALSPSATASQDWYGQRGVGRPAPPAGLPPAMDPYAAQGPIGAYPQAVRMVPPSSMHFRAPMMPAEPMVMPTLAFAPVGFSGPMPAAPPPGSAPPLRQNSANGAGSGQAPGYAVPPGAAAGGPPRHTPPNGGYMHHVAGVDVHQGQRVMFVSNGQHFVPGVGPPQFVDARALAFSQAGPHFVAQPQVPMAMMTPQHFNGAATQVWQLAPGQPGVPYSLVPAGVPVVGGRLPQQHPDYAAWGYS